MPEDFALGGGACALEACDFDWWFYSLFRVAKFHAQTGEAFAKALLELK